MLKSFREYTNSHDEEGCFKGWSHHAAADMAEHIQKMKEEGIKEKLFPMAFRLTHQDKQGSGKKKKSSQESAPVNYETDIWGLEKIDEMEEI